MNQYGEPWSLCERQIVDYVEEPYLEEIAFIRDANGFIKAALDNCDSYEDNEIDANRICACVNALAGIEDPEAFVKRAKKLIDDEQFMTELCS